MRVTAVLAAAVVIAAISIDAQRGTPPTPRLYVFDGGTLASADMSRYRLRDDEVATTKMSVACYAVVHSRGVLVWDTCAVPDESWTPTGKPELRRLTLPDGQMREVTLRQHLLPQLAAAGIRPEQVSYLALSHYHWDHTANANAFTRAMWIARPVERDAMFMPTAPPLTQPRTYRRLNTSKPVLITGDEHDVFGDGSVVIKLAAGHTPGHQVLLVKLPRTGPVILSGDLYPYTEERTLGGVPTFEADQGQTAASRRDIDAFLRQTGAQLWIQHDFAANAKIRKAPAYYD
jgi:glyoxylase-like metal-dependent hydrolase (beta-lactamase superfamily II)